MSALIYLKENVVDQIPVFLFFLKLKWTQISKHQITHTKNPHVATRSCLWEKFELCETIWKGNHLGKRKNWLSQNFLLFLHYSEPGASSHPCSDSYHGNSAMSEEEVQAVAKYLESLGRRLVAFLDIHSYSQMLMFPWGYTKTHCKDYLELVMIL